MTRKVWALVEVNENSNRLVGGIDPDAARDALADMYAFVPGDGPREVFRNTNPMYVPRKSMKEVLSERGIDADAIAAKIVAARWKNSEARGKSGRAAEWAIDHNRPEEEWFTGSRARIERSVSIAMASGEEPGDVVLHDVHAITGVPVADLAAEMRGDLDAPFFSEAYLYTLVGKDIARSILARLSRLKSALGQDPPDRRRMIDARWITDSLGTDKSIVAERVRDAVREALNRD